MRMSKERWGALAIGALTLIGPVLFVRFALRGASFEELCLADRPDAIFVPHATAYPDLHEEILAGKCIHNYRPVTSPDGAQLFIRKDRLRDYRRGGR